MLCRRLQRTVVAGAAPAPHLSSSSHIAAPSAVLPFFAVCASATAAALRPTRALLAFKKMDESIVYNMGLATDSDELGKEVDLGDEGLNLSAIEEYSKEDMALRTQQMGSLYSSPIYAFCFYPCVDVVYLMNELDLLPPIRPEATVSHWMADPRMILRQPRILADIMGHERWDRLSGPLTEMTENLSEFSPLVRYVRRHKLPRGKWLPFLRQLAVEEATTVDKTLIPAMALSMCNGRLPDDWGLPSDPTQRTVAVCELLLALAAETGALSVGTVACRILRLHQIAMTFPLQKLLMCAFAAHARRRLDWDARMNGALTTAVSQWRREYFAVIESDLDAAASGMAGGDLGDLGSGASDDDFDDDGDAEEGDDDDDEDEDDDEGGGKRKQKRSLDDDDGGDGLEQYEERLASNAGISPTEFDDDGLFEGVSEVGDEGIDARRRQASYVNLKKRNGMRALSRDVDGEGDGDEEERNSDAVAAMAAADDALEGMGGGGGAEFDEEEEDEDVFVDPATKANVSTYFTSGSHLTRAQTLSSSTKSKAMEKKQQRRDETMRRRLLGRITSQMVKGKKSGAASKNAAGKSPAKRGRKKAGE